MTEQDGGAVEPGGTDDGAEREEQAEEAVAPQIMRDPGQPTAREREEHEVTHLPPRPWCKWCCLGRGQHDHHRTIVRVDEPQEIAIPAISLDYCFMGNSRTRAADNPVLVAFDNRTNAMAAWQVFEKGAIVWVASEVNRFIDMLGYGKVRISIRSDGERSITALKKLIAGFREAPTVSVETPARESKCNGAMEVRVKSWQSQFRTMLMDLQGTIQRKIPLGKKVIGWLVSWAAATLNRYKMDNAGRAAFQRVTGGTRRRPIAKFDESVLWMENGKRDPGLKAEGNMHEGVFIGIKGLSTEAVIATAEGIVHARTVRRRPVEERWNAEAILDVKLSPDEVATGGDHVGSGGAMRSGGDYVISFDDKGHDGERNEPNAETEDRAEAPTAQDEPHVTPDGFDQYQEPVTPEGSSQEQPVQVRTDEDHRVIFQPSGGDEMDDAGDEEVHGDDGMEDQMPSATPSPKPNRRRLRPIRESMDTGETSSPEPQQPQAMKMPRQEDDMDDALNQLETVRSELEVERSRVDKRIMALAVNGVDVTEVYSPSRVVDMAVRMGLVGGRSMDLNTGWDFSLRSDWRKAIEIIIKEDPWMIVGSPPCTMLSLLQNLNIHQYGHKEEWKLEFEKKKKRAAEEHVKFCTQLYRLQMSRGRYFVHEHPDGATSWELTMIGNLAKEQGVIRVKADQCMYGLETEVKGETRPVRKRTGFLTNSVCVADELSRRCDGSHLYFTLMEGRAAKAEEYPPDLCKAICRGIRKQQSLDQMGMCCSLGMVVSELEDVLVKAGYPKHWVDKQHDDPLDDEILMKEIMALRIKNGGQAWATDDLSGAVLDPELVQRARDVEMEYFRKMVVYNKVNRSEAKGRKIIRTKWVDVTKGDSQMVDYRSRLIAMEFNDAPDPSLLASTPPLEAMRYIIHQAATTGRDEAQCVMLVDVKRAYFNSEATRDIFIEIPKEDRVDGDETKIGKLRLCLYGTRDAAFNWGETVARQLLASGYERGKAFPAIYHHVKDGVSVMVHGDDYLCAGPEKALMRLKAKLSEAFEIKSSAMGTAAHLDKEGKILSRIVRVTANGWEVEADQRHGELIVQEMELDKAKGLSTPGIDEPLKDDDEPLRDWRVTRYRSLAARANYLALDRPDLQFAVKEMCRSMSRPTERSWRQLTRVAKYLIAKPRMVMRFDWQEPTEIITTCSDANWAGCLHSRKSTSGGSIMTGSHLIKTWSKTQANIALSSAESDLYATLKAAQESLGVIAMAMELSQVMKARLQVDASAALGVAQRAGIGKIRHLQTGALWLQEQELRKKVKLGKIPGSDNPSDVMTKNVSRELLEKHLSGLSCMFSEGRADKAVNLHLLSKMIRQAEAELKGMKNKSQSQCARVDWDKVNIIEHDIESYVCNAEFDAMVRGDQLIDSWRKEQCREIGQSRKTLLRGTSR